MSGYTEIALLQYELEKLRAELAEQAADAVEFQSCITATGNAATGYDWGGGLAEYVADAFKQLAALKAENESLKLDAARYQWLKNNNSPIGIYSNADFDDCYYIHEPDETIDAAMIAGEK